MDFSWSSVPWNDYRSDIISVHINNGATSIGSYAFAGCYSLNSIVVPYGMDNIGDWAFAMCEELDSITIPNSVTSIGYSTFYMCSSLEGIVIPDSITSLDEKAFMNCTALQTATIGNGLTELKDDCFYGCKLLAEVSFGDSLSSISNAAFAGCKSLASITASTENPYFSSLDGVLFNKDISVLVRYPAGRPGEYTIPPGVTAIGEHAFDSCRYLQDLVIPDSVTSIGEYAFYSSFSLRTVDTGSGVLNIGECAFESCGALESVTFSPVLESIGIEAFEFCYELESVEFPQGLISIGDCAFAECNKIHYIFIPETVTFIGQGAFCYCSSLKNALFFGAPPAVEGNCSVMFSECASGFIIYYTSDYASIWSPNGQTYWNGYSIAIRPVCSVVFIDPINNTTISDQQVPWGEAAAEPEAPHHVGYKFIGWDKSFDFITTDSVVNAIFEKVNVIGDIDGDGRITFVDVTAICMYLTGDLSINEELQDCLDFNGDGVTSYADLTDMYYFIISA